jgi:hypothetical protein
MERLGRRLISHRDCPIGLIVVVSEDQRCCYRNSNRLPHFGAQSACRRGGAHDSHEAEFTAGMLISQAKLTMGA